MFTYLLLLISWNICGAGERRKAHFDIICRHRYRSSKMISEFNKNQTKNSEYSFFSLSTFCKSQNWRMQSLTKQCAPDSSTLNVNNEMKRWRRELNIHTQTQKLDYPCLAQRAFRCNCDAHVQNQQKKTITAVCMDRPKKKKKKKETTTATKN